MGMIFNPTYWWFFLGLIAFGLAGVNLMLYSLGKAKHWKLLLFLSMSFGLVAAWAVLVMVANWVHMEDWSALMDVVPAMLKVMAVAVGVGIVLNGMVLVQHRKEK